MANDEHFYVTVAEELERGQIDKALWTKAFTLSGGEENATKSHYCRLRVEQLHGAVKQQDRSVRLAHVKTHSKQLGFGVFLLAIGLVVTGFSYNAAELGGHYIVTRALLIGGFIVICKGLWGLSRSAFIRSTPSGATLEVPDSTQRASSQATSTKPAIQTTPETSPTPSTPESKPGQISTETGCFIIILSATVIVGLMLWAGSSSTSTTTPQASSQPFPFIVAQDQRAALDKRFSDLDAEYRALNARKAALDLNDPNQLAAYNRDAADYTRRVQEARNEKARLER